MMLAEAIAGLEIRVVRGDASRARICDLTEDSRTVMPGSMFVARRGLASDGRAFVSDAAQAGAVAILTDDESVPPPRGVVMCVCDDVAHTSALLAERFYGNPTAQLKLVGVTGTNGKTTIAHLVHQILNRCSVRCGQIGTVFVDDGREIAAAAMTTPPAIELSRTFATMVESGCRAAVMEVSSHALHQKRVDGLRFDVAIFTNLTHDHRDYHKTQAEYLASKRRLFELLVEDGLGIVNGTDAAEEHFCSPRMVRCGFGDQFDWRVQIERTGLEGMELELIGDGVRIEASTTMFGRYNAMNVLQSVIAAREVLRSQAEAVQRRLERAVHGLTAPPGRLERVSEADDDIDVFVDFAHTPDALANVLSATREASGSRRICVVFGCGGDRDQEKRPEMGAIAAAGADRVIVTSDNPRREPPGRIVSEILSGMDDARRRRAEVHVDRGLAIRCAIIEAAPGDVVVIAGKGHECVQVLPDGVGRVREVAFDDAAQARAVLTERRVLRGESVA